MTSKYGEALREYAVKHSVVFHKTNELWGGLSNMSSGFPLLVNGNHIRSSEALYQACRFPGHPEIQKSIIDQTSPMTAKMVSKPFREKTRSDWEVVRVLVMKWCVRVKLMQNWDKFGELLISTGDSPIVEFSRKDIFWGAKPVGDEYLVGVNALGRILMELRDKVAKTNAKPDTLPPLPIQNFFLYGRDIEKITSDVNYQEHEVQPELPY